MPISRSLSSWAMVLALTLPTLFAQQVRRVPPRINQDIDEAKLVTLRGNTHPLARAEYDQGAAPRDLPMERMLLLLSRSPEQEAALRQLLEEQQDSSSANYRQWLTPEQFGDQFGAAPEDIDTITSWLSSQGFRVDRVSNGRGVIEFSGTAGEVERALHTQIHSYLVHGKQHWANSQEPRIPAALSPAVAGIVSLHNFTSSAMRHGSGTAEKEAGSARWTAASPRPRYTTRSYDETDYVVAPYDFATIYNVLPLWSAGVDGTGQSIAIVARSNIALADVENFRSIFGLPARDPIITLNGADPGLTASDEDEAAADAEWSGAVAKGATINLVVSKSTTASDGVDLSAEYIVDKNLAPVLSSSYGTCETEMTAGEKQLYPSLWQQAAAEGITVVVAAGDGGSAFCDTDQPFTVRGLQVNGMASTPYDVAVGGTDFDDVLDQTAIAYWNTSNNPATLASAKSYVPEMTWNDSCAGPQALIYLGYYFTDSTAEALCNDPLAQGIIIDLLDVIAGGGGVSSTYAKPSWQSGVTGIPADGQRDLPDVSLFAGDGLLSHYYPVCQADQGATCNPSGPNGIVVDVDGGTSSSAQDFAGIMAMVNQKMGSRQGLANPTLYKLASIQYGNSANSQACNTSYSIAAGNSCVFYDVTSGTSDVPCLYGTLNCYLTNPLDTYGLLSTSSTSFVPAYSAGPGYDLATGLGSVNVTNLVNQWSAVTNPPVLSVGKTHTGSFTQGQTNVTYTVTVSNSASAGPTAGTVTVSEAVPGALTLVSMAGASWTCGGSTCTRSDALTAGASYPAITVTANVASNAASQVTNQVTVSGGGSASATANDVTNIAPFVATIPTTTTVAANPSTIPPTASTTLTATVTAASGSGTPTGTVAFDLGNTLLGSVALTGTAGTAQAMLIVNGSQLTVGSNTITAFYSGDANFAGSSASTTVTVTTLPSITPGGVVNAASYSTGPVAPGEIVSIFGTNIGPANYALLTLDSTGKVSTSIGGVTVSFNGFLAPLTYVSSTQINAIVPYEIAGNTSPSVQVTYGGQTSNPFALQLTAAAPALFTQNSSGSGPADILNQDYSLNTQNNPAAKGSVLQIFLTGEGLTNPAQATGAVTPVNTSGVGPVTPAPQQAVSVMIGGQFAKLDFAGEAPGLVAGVLQVDAEVPVTANSGTNPITVRVGNQISQSGVTVWVQ